MARESREVWSKRVERWRESGLSIKEFARELGINAHTLAGWRWRLRAVERSGATPHGSDPSRRRGGAKRERPPIELIEIVRDPAGEHPFEVTSASGWTVRVPAHFDGEALRRLLSVLAAA